jgi:hypothetical protein
VRFSYAWRLSAGQMYAINRGKLRYVELQWHGIL